MAEKHLIGIDIGTQGTKAALFTEDGRCLAEAFQKSDLYQPSPGIVEEDPITQTIVNPQVKGYGAVEGILLIMVCKAVGVPVLKSHTRLIERTRFLTQTQKPLTGLKFLVGSHPFATP